MPFEATCVVVLIIYICVCAPNLKVRSGRAGGGREKTPIRPAGLAYSPPPSHSALLCHLCLLAKVRGGVTGDPEQLQLAQTMGAHGLSNSARHGHSAKLHRFALSALLFRLKLRPRGFHEGPKGEGLRGGQLRKHPPVQLHARSGEAPH